MNPAEALEKLLGIDRRAGAILLAGVAAFGTVATVKSYGFDSEGATAFAVTIVLMGLLVIVAGRLAHDSAIIKVVSWFLVTVFMVYFSALVVSVIVPGQTFVAPFSCLLRPGSPCNAVGGVNDRLAAEAAPSQPPVTVPPTAAAEAVGRQQVFVQFAGLITRENIIALAKGLAAAGWNMQGSDRGGERTSAAIGYNEVRYPDDSDRAAAEKLAEAISATGIVAKPVTAKKAAIAKGTLEVWLSRS